MLHRRFLIFPPRFSLSPWSLPSFPAYSRYFANPAHTVAFPFDDVSFGPLFLLSGSPTLFLHLIPQAFSLSPSLDCFSVSLAGSFYLGALTEGPNIGRSPVTCGTSAIFKRGRENRKRRESTTPGREIEWVDDSVNFTATFDPSVSDLAFLVLFFYLSQPRTGAVVIERQPCLVLVDFNKLALAQTAAWSLSFSLLFLLFLRFVVCLSRRTCILLFLPLSLLSVPCPLCI